jgi:predicted nucleotidyltransferase
MPTALELSREEWGRYIKAAGRRPVLPEMTPEEEQDRKQLLARIQEASTAMKKRFSVRRVILFGSLAHSAWFIPDSDVDLAVEGLNSESYWEAWGLAEDIIATHPVDLIEVEKASESLRRSIERYGTEL